MTWLGGMVLLFLVYYIGSGLIDPDVAEISKCAGIAIGLGASSRDGYLRSGSSFSVRKVASSVRSIRVGHDSCCIVGTLPVFSGRAAYIHVGAIFGTIMTANVGPGFFPRNAK